MEPSISLGRRKGRLGLLPRQGRCKKHEWIKQGKLVLKEIFQMEEPDLLLHLTPGFDQFLIELGRMRSISFSYLREVVD